jgi:hypothetical protein
MDRPRIARWLRIAVSAVFVAASLLGLMCLPFAYAGFTGRLADVSRRENVDFGLQCLSITILCWISSGTWYWLCNHPVRFSLRTLLIATTLIAVVLGLVVAFGH